MEQKHEGYSNIDSSDQRLLASVISDGKCGKGAFGRAGRLLSGYGSAAAIAAAPEPVGGPFCRVLTPAERRRLADARELARRMAVGSDSVRPVVSTPADVAAWAAHIAYCREEVLIMVGLDARNRVVGNWEISRGWESGINVHPRQVFTAMIRECVGRGVIVHNHPSGNPDPSDEDVRFTRQIIQGAKVLGIDIVDHVVVTGRAFSSMRSGCRDLEFGQGSG